VCDDGSTDDLARALSPFLGRIRLISRPNGGEGAAKNDAIRAASTEFAVVLDADDVFEPTRLERLDQLLTVRPDLDVATTDALLEVNGQVVGSCYSPTWTFEVDDQRAAILERNFVFGLAAVRRSKVLAVGGFDTGIRVATDWDLWLRLVVSGSRIGLVDEPLARYRLTATSLSGQRSRLLRGRAVVLRKASQMPALTDEERALAGRRAELHEATAMLAAAYEAVADRSQDARTLALAAARNPRLPRGTRIRAALAALSPRWAAAMLRRQERLHGRAGPAGVRFGADGASAAPTAPEQARL